MSELKH